MLGSSLLPTKDSIVPAKIVAQPKYSPSGELESGESPWQAADIFEVPDERIYSRSLRAIAADKSDESRPHVTAPASPTPLGKPVAAIAGAAAARALLAAGRERGNTNAEAPPPTLVAAPDGRRSRRDEALRKPRASQLGLPPSSPAPPVAPIPPQLPPPEPPPLAVEPRIEENTMQAPSRSRPLASRPPSRPLVEFAAPWESDDTLQLHCGSRPPVVHSCNPAAVPESPIRSPLKLQAELFASEGSDLDAGGGWASALPRPPPKPETPENEITRFALLDSVGLDTDGDGVSFQEEEIIDSPRHHLAKWLVSADLSTRSTGSWAGDRVQQPYHNDAKPTSTALQVRQEQLVVNGSSRSVLASYLRNGATGQGTDGRDGTVGHEPRSPPVVGRSINIQFEASFLTGFAVSGPNAVTMPKLQSDAVAQACTRAPWPPDTGMRPGLKAQVAETSTVEAPSVFAFLRSHFLDVDADNDRQVNEAEFIAFVILRTTRQCSWEQVPEECEQLLKESAIRCYRQAVVRDAGIRVEDWVHFGLLLTSSPSHVAHHLLNQRLRRELRRNPFLLKEILHAFEQADMRGAGVLQAADVEEAFVQGETFVKDMNLKPDDQVTYYDFVAYCLGYRKHEVALNWYDVSHGFARWVPTAVLGGEKFAGIWHTGIVAFGKEYWYGGKVLSSEPGMAPFPPGPARTTVLGTTLRTKEELEDFLRFEMAPRYTREQYDVLRRNCNHFTDEVTAFLIQGAHIPDEARFQPEVVMNAPLLEGIRPYLNHWLGGFEAGGCEGQIDDLMTEWRARLWPGDLALYVPQAQFYERIQLVRVSNVDSWRGVCDIAYFESDGPALAPLGTARSQQPGSSTATPHSSDSGDVAESRDTVTACAVSSGSSDARVLRLGSCVSSGSFWDWQVQRRIAVPLSCLRPHTLNGRGLAGTAGAGLGHLARAALRTSNPELQTHLRRKAIVYAHCPQGHVMRAVQPEQGRRAWDELMQSALSCGICSKEIPRRVESRLQCSSCNFYLCSPCDRKGLFRGYYSLGCIDQSTSKLLMQEPAWVRYKAQRYMSAAGVASGTTLSLELWQQKVAYRLFTDLGAEPPSQAELMDMYRRFNKTVVQGKQPWGGYDHLDCDRFTELLMELLALHATVVTL